MSSEKLHIPALEEPPKSRNRLDRLTYLFRTQGFLANSGEEINDAFGVVKYAYEGRSADDWLRDIRTHQINVSRDKSPTGEISIADEIAADNTVGRVTSRIVGYHKTAHAAYTHLGDLLIDIESTWPAISIATKNMLADFTPLTLSAAFLVRYLDISNLAKRGNFPEGIDPLKLNYGSTRIRPELRDHIYQAMGETNLHDAWLATDEAMAAEYARGLFWSEIQEEIAPYAKAHGVGRLALGELPWHDSPTEY